MDVLKLCRRAYPAPASSASFADSERLLGPRFLRGARVVRRRRICHCAISTELTASCGVPVAENGSLRVAVRVTYPLIPEVVAPKLAPLILLSPLNAAIWVVYVLSHCSARNL